MCEHTFVRWDELKVEAEEERQLPGYRDSAVVRRFDAPEALDTRFYEVRAKSALNRVPEASQVPFRWTINPYRGCTHACIYCLEGSTPILMADGRAKPLVDVRPGDSIYGTVRDRFHRRYVVTQVLDHWSTVKPAYRVTLEDGTELVTSGDHRFLTLDGWKHVVGAGPGRAPRAHLRRNDRMMGVGRFAPGPERSDGYRRAYVSGMARGDSRPLADPDAFQRLVDYAPRRTEAAFEDREVIDTASKCNLAGLTVKSNARLRVASIEPLGDDLPLYDITTGTGDFVANGVVSHNCFARPTHKFLDMNAGRDFEREIVVKVNVPEVLRRDLARPSWKGEHVALGTNTDPYQWVEGRYKLMPGIWEAFRDFRNPCSVLTKSPLLLRDVALMKEVAEVAPITASLSVPTLEEKAWRATEPRTPHPRARIEAVAELNRAGIPAGVLVAPLMPGINDSPEQVERILELCAEAGAVHVGGIALHLRGDVRGIFMDWLRSQRPDLVPRYEELYARGAYAQKAERERLGRLVWRGQSRLAGYVRDRPNMDWRPRDRGEAKPEPPAPLQPSLF
jgi:DNA repair photolyase